MGRDGAGQVCLFLNKVDLVLVVFLLITYSVLKSLTIAADLVDSFSEVVDAFPEKVDF